MVCWQLCGTDSEGYTASTARGFPAFFARSTRPMASQHHPTALQVWKQTVLFPPCPMTAVVMTAVTCVTLISVY